MPKARVAAGFVLVACSVGLALAAPAAAREAAALRLAVEQDPSFAAWSATFTDDALPARAGCATSDSLAALLRLRHQRRAALLASLERRGIAPASPPPGVAPWPWGIVAPVPRAAALVDSGDTALLVDTGTITYTNRYGQPEVDPFHAAQAFYAGHHDEYDFLVVFTNFYSQLGGGSFLAYHNPVANGTYGLGYAFTVLGETFDRATEYTHKPQAGRLQSFVHMNDIRGFPDDAQAIFDGHYSAVTLLGHEVGHRWLARVMLEWPGYGPAPVILGRQYAHWSFFFNAGASPLEGNAWGQDGGTFSTLDQPLAYGPLDLYLMGMIAPDEIAPGVLWHIRDINTIHPPTDAGGFWWNTGSRPTPGVSCDGQRYEFSVTDVAATNGQRVPAYPDAPRDFRVAFALVTRSLESVTAADLARLATLRREFATWFTQATLGRGHLDTRLRPVPARMVFVHRPHGNFEDPTRPIPFATEVVLEPWSLPTRLEDVRVTLHWSVDDGPFVDTPMTAVVPGRFGCEIPAQPFGTQVRYALRATSAFPDHETLLPGPSLADTYGFRVDADNGPPSIQHAVRSEWSRFAEPPLLRALVRDAHGVESVWVEMHVAGGEPVTHPLLPVGTTDLYEARPPLPGRAGDVVLYRILARDVSAAGQTSVSPAAGFHALQLTRPLVEGAETDDPMWTHRSLVYDRPDEWHREIVNPIEGLHSWKVGPSYNTVPGVIAARADAVLESPAIDIYPGAGLSISHRYAFLTDEFDPTHYAIDGGLVQYQDVVRDGPADQWWLIDPDAGYPRTLSHEAESPLTGYPVFGGVRTFAREETFAFQSWHWNRKIRVRFRVVTSPPIPRRQALDGWVIDAIRIDPGRPPTPVTLEAVTATPGAAGVLLAWAAADLGPEDSFTIARGRSAAGGPPAGLTTIGRIAALPGRRLYEFVDSDPGAVADLVYRVGLWSGGIEVAAQTATVAVPRRFVLHPNVPNPFNPTTGIAFELPARDRVRLAIHDVRGRVVRVLDDATLDPGRHQRTWDGTDAAGRAVASGVYLLRLEQSGRAASQRLVLLR